MSKHLLLSVLASFLIATFAPVSAGASGLAAAAIVPAALLLAVVAYRTVSRREALEEAIDIELGQARRLYELGSQLGYEARHRQWFTELHGHLHAYLAAFDKKPFARYEENGAFFRKVNQHLFLLPGLDAERERILWHEAIEAVSGMAGARRCLQALLSRRLPPAFRHGLLACTALAGLAVLAAMGPSDRFIAGCALSVLAAATACVFDLEDRPDAENDAFSKRYVEELNHLEK